MKTLVMIVLCCSLSSIAYADVSFDTCLAMHRQAEAICAGNNHGGCLAAVKAAGFCWFQLSQLQGK